jgi:anti-sigma-K factor RskA
MSNQHIINLIDEKRITELSETELSTVRAHVSACDPCRRAFEAAQLSALLLQERAAEAFTAPAFFHTRVLATLRERNNANQPWAWTRIWQAAGALASSMVVTVAALAVLTFAIPGSPDPLLVTDIAANNYAEEMMLSQGELADDQVSDGQILKTLYAPDEEGMR